MRWIQCDRQQDSYIAAFDLTSGNRVWQTPRDEVPSWGTPTVYDSEDGPAIATNGTNFARGYDLLTGRELWKLSGNAAITVPTPLVAHGLIYVTSGYRPIQPIFAVRPSASGEINAEGSGTSSALAWTKERGGPYLPTPIILGNFFYACSNNGIITCLDARTGKQVYRKRFARTGAASFSASPVAADGTIYLTAEAGVVYALDAGPRFKSPATHEIGEYCLSTPAIAGRVMLIRTTNHLIAVGSE